MTSKSKQIPKRENPLPAEVWIPADPSGNGRSRWPSNSKLLLAGFFALIFVLILGFALIFALLFFYSDMIVPGIQVMDVNVGSMTRAEAAAVLQDRWQQQQVILEHSDGTWMVGAADLGMSLDVEATVEHAYAQGRSFDSLLGILQEGLHGQPVWSFDSAVAV